MPPAWNRRPLPAAAAGPVEAGLETTLARLLALRGIDSKSAAERWTGPTPAELHAPEKLLGMAEAVDRIAAVGAGAGPVVVVGDYDVDGITASAILVAALQALGIPSRPILPSRQGSGYGLQPVHVDRALELRASLVVTADNGMHAHDALEHAAARGLPVIVTDHHLPGAEPLPAVAVINPRQAGCTYPFRELCGAALAFKLAAALFNRRGREAPLDALLRMACLGTIADSVALVGENRAIAKLGLAALSRTRSPGLRALFDCARIEGTVTASDVAFRIGPRLNAPGRVADPDPALELLLTRDTSRARELASQIEEANRLRQQLEREVLDACAGQVEANADSPLFVGWSSRWHRGVVGIAAGRLARELQRPVVLCAVTEDGFAIGSGRSVEGFDLHALLAPARDAMLRFGGHSQAIGLTARADRLPELRDRWIDAAHRASAAEGGSTGKPIEYDLDLSTSDATLDLARTVERLGPFGTGNPEPTFRLGPLTIRRTPRAFGNGHLQITAQDAGGAACEIVAWRSDRLDVDWKSPFELLAALEIDSWSGTDRPRLRLVDVRAAT